MIEFSHTNASVKDNLARLLCSSFTFPDLCAALSKPKIITDKMMAGYLLRCLVDGTRNDKNAADESGLLILDGDSHIDTNTGEIVNGAVPAWEVHLVLNHLNIDHFIHTSHSNSDHIRKYRALIPCHYTRQQLPALLDWIFERLHENGVMLHDAKEGHTWAQAWFKPSVHPDRQHLFKTFSRIDGVASHPSGIELLPAPPFDVEAIYRDWAVKQNKQSPVKNHVTTLSVIQVTPNGLVEINPIKEFNKTYTIHEILISAGYRFIERENKYLRPNSQSGVAGVNVLDNGLIYSHGDDVLNVGRAIDAFECFTLLHCGGDKNKARNWNPEITKHNQMIFRKLKTVKPHDIRINAASKICSNITPNESFRPSQFANSIG